MRSPGCSQRPHFASDDADATAVSPVDRAAGAMLRGASRSDRIAAVAGSETASTLRGTLWGRRRVGMAPRVTYPQDSNRWSGGRDRTFLSEQIRPRHRQPVAPHGRHFFGELTPRSPQPLLADGCARGCPSQPCSSCSSWSSERFRSYSFKASYKTTLVRRSLFDLP